MDHPGQLVKQQHQGQPALGQFGPVLQVAVQCLLDQRAEALARLGILLWTVAEPEPLFSAAISVALVPWPNHQWSKSCQGACTGQP